MRIDPRAAVTVIHPPRASVGSPASGAAPPRLSVPEDDGDRQSWQVLCSPLTGRAGGVRDVRPVAERLSDLPAPRDAAAAPGDGSLLAVDDGRRDVAGAHALLSVIATDIGGFTLEVCGEPVGLSVPDPMVPRAAAAAAGLLVAQQAPIPGAARGAVDAVRRLLAGIEGVDAAAPAGTAAPAGAAAEIGWIPHDADDRVTLGAATDGAVLDARRLQFIAAIGCPVIVGPRRTLLLCDLDEWTAEQVVRVLAPMGFVFDADSPTVRELDLSCAPPSPGSAPNAAP